MCVFSAMGEHYRDKWNPEDWKKQYPQIPHPFQQPGNTNLGDLLHQYNHQAQIDLLKKQLEELRKEVLEMKEILKVAKDYDERNNEPHCEMEEKVKLLKEVAKLVGVDLRDVFPEPIPVVTSGYYQVVGHINYPYNATVTSGSSYQEQPNSYVITYDPNTGIAGTMPVNTTPTKPDPKY